MDPMLEELSKTLDARRKREEHMIDQIDGLKIREIAMNKALEIRFKQVAELRKIIDARKKREEVMIKVIETKHKQIDQLRVMIMVLIGVQMLMLLSLMCM
jgi:hypothetical protein